MRVWAPLLDSSSQAHTDTCAAAWPGGRAAFALLTQGGALQLEILFYFILFYFILFIYLFIYGCVGSLHRLSLVVVTGGYSSLWCVGFSLRWLLLLRSTGSRHQGFSSCGMRASVVVARGLYSAGSVVVAHELSCSAAYGIFPDQGSNPCPLHWQADSQPLCHQGSPRVCF